MTTIPFVIAGTGLPEVIRLAQDVCVNDSRFQLLGFLDDNALNASRNLYGYNILGGFDYIEKNEGVFVVNAIARNCELRAASTGKLIDLGARFINLIHPSVLVDFDSIGVGNVVDRGCVLHRGVRLGDHNIFLTGVVIGHDSIVGDLNFMGHNVVVNGHSKIGRCSFFGANSVLGPLVSVGDYCTVGPCCSIHWNLPDGVTLGARPPLNLKVNPIV